MHSIDIGNRLEQLVVDGLQLCSAIRLSRHDVHDLLDVLMLARQDSLVEGGRDTWHSCRLRVVVLFLAATVVTGQRWSFSS